MSGDLLPVLALLTYEDSIALKDGFPDNAKELGVGLSTLGRPATSLDSMRRVGSPRKDTALFVAYMTGPNWEQGFAGLMQAAMSGLRPDEEAIKGTAATLPRVTSVDSIIVVNEGGDWKVSLGVRERRELNRLGNQLTEGYLQVPLRQRAMSAKAFVSRALKRPGLASSYHVEAARKLAREASVAESLTIDLVVRDGFLLPSATGTVRNASSTPIRDLWIRARDGSGKEASIQVYRVPARGIAEVYDQTTLAVGRPVQVFVLALELPGN